MSEPRFEERLKELEEILRRLERGELSLDESVSEYEKGIAALRSCRSVLESAERKIEELVRAPDGSASSRPFEHEAFKS